MKKPEVEGPAIIRKKVGPEPEQKVREEEKSLSIVR